MGIGHFYGLMPNEIMANSHLYGVELDSISARIAQQLYQGAQVVNKGFEKVKYPDDYFDLFISNVPFGDYKLFDPDMRKVNFLILLILREKCLVLFTSDFPINGGKRYTSICVWKTTASGRMYLGVSMRPMRILNVQCFLHMPIKQE